MYKEKKSIMSFIIKFVLISFSIVLISFGIYKGWQYLKGVNSKVLTMHKVQGNNNKPPQHNDETKNKTDENNKSNANNDSNKTNDTKSNDNKSKESDEKSKKHEEFMKNAIDASIVHQLMIPNSDRSALPHKDGQPVKTAFLTFDDGPSTTVTPQILDILKRYNIHATFFVIGKNVASNDQSKALLKRIHDEGHAIGYHSYSHRMDILYPNGNVNVDAFAKETSDTDAAVKSVLGQDFTTHIMRMPGGYGSRVAEKDGNLPALDEYLKKNNFYNLDWNGLIGDAIGKPMNPQELLEYYKTTRLNDTYSLILMHDTYGKETTAQTLPQLIEFLKSEGFQFKAIG